MTPEQQRALAKARARLRVPAQPQEPAWEKEARNTLSYTPAELIAGSAPGRFALGAAAPILGIAQIGAEALGDTTGTETLKSVEELKRRGMEAYDQQGTDWIGLGGAMLSPVALKAMKIAPAATVAGRAGQGAAIGAGAGAATPVTDEDFWSTKGVQIGTGLTLGAAIPLTIDGVRYLYDIGKKVIQPLLPGGTQRAAGKFLAEAAGPKRQEIERLLAENKKLVPGSQGTAAEVASPAGSAEFSALEQAARKIKPTAYDEIDKAQQAVRLSAVRDVGKTPAALASAIKERADDAAEAYGNIRHLKVDPRSDIEIMSDAIASKGASKGEALRDWGRFATREAEMETRGATFTPVSGMPRVSGRASNFPERADEARAAASEAIAIAKQRYGEEKFLENTMELMKETVGLDSKPLRMFLTRPSMKEAISDAAKSAQEQGVYFPTKAGDKFSVGNLQRIKESLDAGITASEKSASVGRRPELSSSELTSTRKAFVDWLSNKVPQWRDARLQYAAASKPINEMEVGQELQKALTKPLGEGERAGVFATAVREAPRTIKKATGQPRYDDLSEVLQPENLSKVKGVLADLSRKAEAERLGKLGASRAQQIEQPFGLPATGPLHQKYMIFKTVLGRVSKGLNDKTIDLISDSLQVPDKTLKLLRAAPDAQRQKIIDNIITAKVGRGAIISGTVSASEGVQQ